MKAAILAKKSDEPPNGAKVGSLGGGSPCRGNAPLGYKEVAGIAAVKRDFTLVEVIVVIVVIALVTSTIGFFLYRAIMKEKFYSEANLVLEKIHAARDLAIHRDSEVRFMLFEGSQGLEWKFLTDEPLTEASRAIVAKDKRLRSISAFSVNESPCSSHEWIFSRMGTAFPTGDLCLYQTADHASEKFVIRFAPFPHAGSE